jgi:tRNA modification GTPase
VHDSRSSYLSEDTVAAISSGLGGAIAVIRLSGANSLSILEKISGKKPEFRKITRAQLRAGGRILDDAMVVFFPKPETYTGEDLVELYVHGGSFVAAEVLKALVDSGARQALPGEFSFRAVRNGKMNLTQARAVADLISATNSGAASNALEKMSGAESRILQKVADELRQVGSLGEIGIDFADQDVDEVSLENLRKKLPPLVEELEKLSATFSRGQKIQEGVRAVFVGLPNAGKSSFFNALLGEDRSIVSEVAGTTRDIVREKLTLQGSGASVTLRLEDTAGLRDSQDQIEKMGVSRTEKAAKEADLIILLADVTGSIPALKAQWQRLSCSGEKVIGVLTKVDLADSQLKQRMLSDLKALGISTWFETSAVQGTGISEAARGIADFCGNWVFRQPGEVVLTRYEEFQAVTEAVAHLKRGLGAPQIDLFAADLRQAFYALAPLIGATLPDDILGRIFSQFCIGK